jgi:hypothetical protein
LCLATYEIAAWLPLTLLWCSKPWLDRTSLFVLARAAFGQATHPRDVWLAQRQVWWSQLLLTWTWRRLSPWRSYTQPVYQLEGLGLRAIRQRLRPLRGAHRMPALLVTGAFSLVEALLAIGLVSLVFWLAPSAREAANLWQLVDGDSALVGVILSACYSVVVLFLEPFYVATGFVMYLDRRMELEAWDIEQDLRRAFPT